MLNDNDLFPSKFLNAASLPQSRGVVEIDRVEIQLLGDPPKKKAVVFFVGLTAGLPLNKTNYSSLVDAFGRDDARWRGKSVSIRKERVTFGGKMVDAIRLYPVDHEEVG